MTYVYLTICVLIGVIILLCAFIVIMQYRHNQFIDDMNIRSIEKHQLWHDERQQLLDRIQSPTFAEYKHQEVKVIKAKNGTDKPDIVIEQL